MGNFNLDGYVTVAERINRAQGQLNIITADPPVMLTDSMGYIRVTVLLADGRTSTGTASFRLDLQGKSAQATNPIEDCETSAIGRALAFLGYESSKGIASREEVAEAQRRAEYQGNGQGQPRQAASQGGGVCADCGTVKVQSAKTGNWYCRPCWDRKKAAEAVGA